MHTPRVRKVSPLWLVEKVAQDISTNHIALSLPIFNVIFAPLVYQKQKRNPLQTRLHKYFRFEC